MNPTLDYLDNAHELNAMAADGVAVILWTLVVLLGIAIIGYARNRRDP